MSIPKEPQQLMINLMYLILTAILALHVSAEIFQGLKLLNNRLEKSTPILKNNKTTAPKEIDRLMQENSEDLKQYVDGVAIQKYAKISNRKFNTHVHNAREVFVVLSEGGLRPTSFPFQTKKISDPTPLKKSPSSNDGQMKSETFKAQQGLFALLKNFDFDAKCEIVSYRLVRVGFREDPVENLNRGSHFNKLSRKLINRAKPRDFYYFEGIKAKCPGDSTGRKLPALVFKII